MHKCHPFHPNNGPADSQQNKHPPTRSPSHTHTLLSLTRKPPMCNRCARAHTCQPSSLVILEQYLIPAALAHAEAASGGCDGVAVAAGGRGPHAVVEVHGGVLLVGRLVVGLGRRLVSVVAGGRHMAGRHRRERGRVYRQR